MKVATIVGARPQFIKCSPVSRELRREADELLIHTGQHYDTAMSDVFFEQLSIPKPDYHLGVGSGSHGAQTGLMLQEIEKILQHENPTCCLVYGDTNSTLAGALAASKLNIPVVHVEAGLRSFNRRMPEEQNRIVTDLLSTICFCPTETAVEHLANEGITENVYLVGDVMLDAFRHHSDIAARQSTILQRHSLRPEEFLLATVHRAENTDKQANLNGILKAFEQLAERGMKVVWPVHPRVRQRIGAFSTKNSNLLMIEPVDYLDMLTLERNSRVILTDSGGVQKEAYWSQVPCVTYRAESEWPETIDSGWNILVDPDPDSIVNATLSARPPSKDSPQWESQSASASIVATLLEVFEETQTVTAQTV